MIVVTTPWLIHNRATTGRAFFSLQLYDVAGGTATYPGEFIYRSLDEDVARDAMPARFMWSNLGEVWGKARRVVLSLPRVAVGELGPIVAVFLFISMFFRIGGPDFVRLRWCFYGIFLAHVAVFAVTRSRPSDLHAYIPLATVLAVGGLARLVGSIDLTSLKRAWQSRDWRIARVCSTRVATVTVLALIAAWPFAIWLRQGSTASVAAALPKLEWLLPGAGEDVPLVMSDQAPAVAWYCDRPAIWLTMTSREYDRLGTNVAPIEVLHFWNRPDPRVTVEAGRADWWRAAYASPKPYKGLVQTGLGGPRPEESLRTSRELAAALAADAGSAEGEGA
jgi:hypothetical protein